MAKTNKPPLLFIHGFRGGPNGLDEIAEHLPDYDIHIPTIPPSGSTALAKYDTQHYVTFIRDYIKKHQLDHPVIIGHSMGSIIAAAVAAQIPELVNQKLILLSPIATAVPRPIAAISPGVIILPNRFVSYVTNAYLATTHHDRPLYKKLHAIAAADAAHYVSRRAVAASAKFSCSHTVPESKITQNTLLVVGDHDRIVPVSAVRQFAKQLQKQGTTVELEVLKGQGHLINYEVPAETAHLIQTFLN